ncbi:kinesin-like protein KIF20B isoform X2 [Panonychus citri]|uniref:kinesin-like protein KIF20B isoform X2 n=1 Tax=Panonychus citri TaxID=50023 RepID=UPI002306EF17|nr:kinesin-like protein KIF20B isoform X2 [Panonychus citri]
MDPLSSSICVLDNSIELVDELTNFLSSTTNITTKSLLTSDDEKIATFLRIRPIDNFTIEESPYKIIDSNKIYIDEKISSNCGSAKKINTTRKVYNFTEILDESVNQLNVFSKCCLPLVEDVLDGVNGILFCYGTTSSGKSFTMRGPHEDPTVNPGLIPLSLKKIFFSRKFIDEPLLAKSKFCDMTLVDQKTQDLEKQYKDSILASRCCRNVIYADVSNNNISFNEDGYQYICYLSYFEIYNEFVYDLLNSSGGRGTALSLSTDEKNRYYVKDLRSVMVSSLTEALKIYSYGWTNLQRNIQTTGLNQNSSRSHSFLCITLIKFREDEGKILEPQVSHLTLGDLAGSERQKKTNTEGCRTKEGGRINNSLMNLSKCIRILRNNQKNSKQEIVPFRDSSLTKFLQPYFIGVGKAAIICNINPAANLVGETRTILEFCGNVSQINTNTLQSKSRFSTYSIPEERSPLEDISYFQNKTNLDELNRLYAKNTELKNRLDELEKENAELKLRDSEKVEVARKASIATSLGITLAHETSIQSISSCFHTQEELSQFNQTTMTKEQYKARCNRWRKSKKRVPEPEPLKKYKACTIKNCPYIVSEENHNFYLHKKHHKVDVLKHKAVQLTEEQYKARCNQWLKSSRQSLKKYKACTIKNCPYIVSEKNRNFYLHKKHHKVEVLKHKAVQLTEEQYKARCNQWRKSKKRVPEPESSSEN